MSKLRRKAQDSDRTTMDGNMSISRNNELAYDPALEKLFASSVSTVNV